MDLQEGTFKVLELMVGGLKVKSRVLKIKTNELYIK